MMIEELNTMSDHELIELEDQLLLKRETDAHLRVRHTGGRFILLVLSIIVWLVLKMIFIKLTMSISGPIKGLFSFVLFFISMAMSIIISQYIWKSIGVTGRYWLRNALHYWPVCFYFGFGLFAFFKLSNV